MTASEHRYLNARWHRVTNDPVTTERRVQVYDEVTGDHGYADVRWVASHVRLGVVRDCDTDAIIDPNPTYA
jgi:hypothetical protein